MKQYRITVRDANFDGNLLNPTSHQENANKYTIASGSQNLYKVSPVWEDECKELPAKFMD